MLVLSRKVGETICIGGAITIKVTAASKGRVRIAIDAPREIPVLRGELQTFDGGDDLPDGVVTLPTVVSDHGLTEVSSHGQ